MYVDSGDHLQTPIISDPTTWGTRDSTDLVELITTGTACASPQQTFVPTKIGSKWNYINLYVAGFYTAPLSGSYIFKIASDDGLTVILNSETIMSNPGYATSGGFTNPITLTAGTKYPLEMLWSNGTGSVNLCITTITVNNGSDIQSTYPFNASCSPTP
jgi:hypothetical protein